MEHKQLSAWRETINIIDESLIMLLGQRYKICVNIAELKRDENIPMMQHDRVKQVIERCVLLGEKFNLPPTLIESIYQLIIEESCRIETEIIDKLE